VKSRDLLVSEALAKAQRSLYAMIYVLLEGSIDAMDVLQETNMAILRHAAQYDPDRPPLPWFKAFAMNQVLYYRRVRRDEKLVFDTDMINDLARILEEEEAGAEEKQPLDLLERCLEKLPPWQRDLLMERYQKGGKVNDMAHKHALSRVSLSVLMFRIRKALKRCMERLSVRSDTGAEDDERAFVDQLEALLDGTATRAERCALAERMARRPDLKRVYVNHACLHALLTDCGQTRGAAPGRPEHRGAGWRRVVVPLTAAAAACVIFGTLIATRWSAWPAITAEAYGDDDAWLAQLTPLDLQAYRENMGFDPIRPEMEPLQKYEPGSIPNPGAGIEIVEMAQEGGHSRLLAKGDRVWREHLKLDAGKMVFRLGTGVQVTLFGPAELRLHDEHSVSLTSGTLLAECGEQPLRVAVQGLSVQSRHVTFCVNASAGRRTDVVVVSGTLQAAFLACGRLGHLAAGDGVRLLTGHTAQRFRCLLPEDKLRARFFAGNSFITMRDRRKS